MCPQQSSEVRQLPCARWQQRVVTGVGLHSKSPQHWSERAQVAPGWEQVVQRPPSHPRLPLHTPPAQQVCPIAPQVGAAARQLPD